MYVPFVHIGGKTLIWLVQGLRMSQEAVTTRRRLIWLGAGMCLILTLTTMQMPLTRTWKVGSQSSPLLATCIAARLGIYVMKLGCM
jgi:hypothetical protein